MPQPIAASVLDGSRLASSRHLDTPQVAGAGCDPSVEEIARCIYDAQFGPGAYEQDASHARMLKLSWPTQRLDVLFKQARTILPFIHAAERRGIEKAADAIEADIEKGGLLLGGYDVARRAALHVVRSLIGDK